mgnify:CR=1 FL=1
MADLDMSDALLDPLFTSKFQVTRRAETVGTNGRSVITPTVHPDKLGVVTVASSSDLQRHPEVQITNRSIMIVSKFPLQAESVGFQPDLVIWRGSQYVVRALDPYQHFGSGFTQALCESMDLIDPVI